MAFKIRWIALLGLLISVSGEASTTDWNGIWVGESVTVRNGEPPVTYNDCKGTVEIRVVEYKLAFPVSEAHSDNFVWFVSGAEYIKANVQIYNRNKDRLHRRNHALGAISFIGAPT
jgi:hypothetical protein